MAAQITRLHAETQLRSSLISFWRFYCWIKISFKVETQLRRWCYGTLSFNCNGYWNERAFHSAIKFPWCSIALHRRYSWARLERMPSEGNLWRLALSGLDLERRIYSAINFQRLQWGAPKRGGRCGGGTRNRRIRTKPSLCDIILIISSRGREITRWKAR